MRVFISSIVFMMVMVSVPVWSQESGSDNTMNGDLNTNTQNSTVNSNNTTQDTSTTTNNYGAGAGSSQPVMSAVSPSLMSSGMDTCLKSKGGGLQLLQVGLSAGDYVQDEECNRRRDSKLLNDLGMKIPAISRMCQNVDNWKAMFVSGSPCPILVNGKMVFGKKAILIMKQRPNIYIPDYSEKDMWGNYVNKLLYDTLLGIGVEQNESDEDTQSELSISERFRTSIKSRD